MSSTGPQIPDTSVGANFLARSRRSGAAEAFRVPTADGAWTSVSWADTARRATDLAAGLLALGVTTEQRVAIASSTRLEWVLADLAVALAGAATTTIYPTTNAGDVHHILTDSASVVVFAEDDTQVAKIRAGDRFVGEVRRVVVFDGAGDGDAVLTLDQLARLGRDHLAEHPDAVTDALALVGPSSLATLIYTSARRSQRKA
jgi:long-chain acyl-CoA synthetase